MGCIDFERRHPVWYHAGSVTDLDGEDVAILTVFNVGYALFQVYTSDIIDRQTETPRRGSPSFDPPERFQGTLVNIWPGPLADLRWPPAKGVVWEGRTAIVNWPYEIGMRRAE